MPRVLTTAAGGDIGIGAIQSLQKASHEVIAVDMNPNSAGLYKASEGVVVPPANHERWPSEIARVVEKHDVDVVIPLIDQELREIGRLRSALSEATPILLPRDELITRTIDKKEMYDYFESNGLRIPETTTADKPGGLFNLNPDAFPRIVKPRYGQGGRGVQLVSSPEKLKEYINESEFQADDLLLQEVIQGPEYTSNVTVTKDNNLISVVTKEVPERDGYTAVGITREEESVKQACRQAYESLKPRGPMNVQHMMDEDGVPHLIEINPRFSGSSCLTVEAGVNEFDLLVRDALGEEIEPVEEYDTGVCMIRYTDQIYLDESSLLD